MVQIINEAGIRPNALGQSLGLGLGQLLGNIGENRAEQNQQGILSRVLLGQGGESDFAQLSPENQIQAQKLMQQQQQSEQMTQQKQMAEQQKIQEKVVPLQMAMQTVQRMRDIGSEGRLGRGSSITGFFGGKASKDVNEYEQLGKSLISLSTNIPIRNRIEFETLAEKLYDSSLPDKAREGVLDAMERIISNSAAQYIGPQNANQYMSGNGEDVSQQQPEQEQTKERPSLESFYTK